MLEKALIVTASHVLGLLVDMGAPIYNLAHVSVQLAVAAYFATHRRNRWSSMVGHARTTGGHADVSHTWVR